MFNDDDNDDDHDDDNLFCGKLNQTSHQALHPTSHVRLLNYRLLC